MGEELKRGQTSDRASDKIGSGGGRELKVGGLASGGVGKEIEKAGNGSETQSHVKYLMRRVLSLNKTAH